MNEVVIDGVRYVPEKKAEEVGSKYKVGQKVKLLHSDFTFGFASTADVVKNCYGIIRKIMGDNFKLSIYTIADGKELCHNSTGWTFWEKEIAPWPDEKQDIREYCKEHRVWAIKTNGKWTPVGWMLHITKPKIDTDWNGWWVNEEGEKADPENFTFPDVPWDKSLIAPDGSMPLMKEEISSFIEGHWYKLRNAGKTTNVYLSSDMKIILDGKPRVCIQADGSHARFGGQKEIWAWNPGDWIEIPEPKEKYVPKKDDPIFAWDDGFDKRCPCPVNYVHHVDENGRVWDYMDGEYCEEGIDYDYYRKYDPALVGVPMNRWPKE